MARTLDFDETGRLVRRARRGDEAAFRTLLEAHRDVITSTLIGCGIRCRETARDLAQEVALRAWTRLDRLTDPKAFPAWVRRVAANAARDHLRRLAVRREDELDGALDLASGDDPHDAAHRRAEVRLMLAALAAEDRETVELLVSRAHGVSVEELASELGISNAAFKMRVVRVRKRLRARLEGLRAGEVD